MVPVGTTRCTMRALAVWLSLGLAGCAAPEAPRATGDVVLIVVDTLRARQLGAYGYPHGTSPVLDTLAPRSVVFENASSASSYTRESVSSLMTGLLPSTDGATGWGARPSESSTALAERFKSAGFRTLFVAGSEMLTDPRFVRGFDEQYLDTSGYRRSGSSEGLTRAALRLLDGDPSARTFLYVHYLDPHGPYRPPARERARFRRHGDPPLRPLSMYEDLRVHAPALAASGFGPGEARFEDVVERYDAEVHATDAAIGTLIRGLLERGRMDDAIVVVTADHGEDFLEHDYVEHAWTLYEESVHVPLLFHGPRWLAPARVTERVSLVDVAPSLLALVGIAPLPGDGRPLFVSDWGEWRARSHGEPVFAELGIETRPLLRSVVSGGWKYVAARRWLTPDERASAVRLGRVAALPAGAQEIDPWGPVVREELYDLTADPGERFDRSAEEPDRLGRLRDLVEARRQLAPVRVGDGVPVPMSEEERERLRALGYL
jgi:arylsulfatase